MARLDVLEPVLPADHQTNIVAGQVLRSLLTVAAFDQWGNIATSFNGRVNMSYSVAGGDLPATLDLVNGTASYVVTLATPAGRKRDRQPERCFGAGPLPPPKTFTRDVEMIASPPAANAQVVTVPPSIPGGEPTYQFTVPDQNLTIVGTLSVTTVADPAGVVRSSSWSRASRSTGTRSRFRSP